MKTREEVIAEVSAVCQQSYEHEDGGCIYFKCNKCNTGWYILESSNDSLWKKYQKGCLTCGGEYQIELGHCEW